MSEFFFSDVNFWFGVAIGVVIILFIIEFIGLVFGISLLGVFDDVPGLDPQADIEAGGVAAMASWLSLDRLPLMIWVVIFLTFFGISGYVVNYFYNALISGAINSFVSIPMAVVLSLILTGRLGGLLACLLPKNESFALHEEDFQGAVATITIGTARSGSPAEARFVDQYSQPHYVLVEPIEPEEQFNPDDQVILIQKGLRGYLATRYR